MFPYCNYAIVFIHQLDYQYIIFKGLAFFVRAFRWPLSYNYPLTEKVDYRVYIFLLQNVLTAR